MLKPGGFQAHESNPQASAAYLRAQFFARRLRELGFFNVAAEVRKLIEVKDSFPWGRLEALGISREAFSRVTQAGIEPLLFFLHPRVIQEQPSLLLYYRSVALISQKGFAALAGVNPTPIENGKISQLAKDTATQIAKAVNRVLSLLAETVQPLRRSYIQVFLYATAGAQVQGSWVNAIGRQGEVFLKELVVRNLWDKITQVVWKDDTSALAAESDPVELAQRAPDIKLLRLRGGFHCVFGSEPDMSFRDPKGRPILAVEVKAGTDPAGALERFGAAMKSFASEKAINPHLTTVYVASCLTDEVKTRLREENPFDYTFLLGDLATDKRSQGKLLGLMLRHLPAD